jgi:hypothetical protein
MIQSFLLHSGTIVSEPMFLAAMRVGARLNLQPNGRRRVEVRTPDGHPLGWLPSEDAQMVTDLIDNGAVTMVRVQGLIPAYGRSACSLPSRSNREVAPCSKGSPVSMKQPSLRRGNSVPVVPDVRSGDGCQPHPAPAAGTCNRKGPNEH